MHAVRLSIIVAFLTVFLVSPSRAGDDSKPAEHPSASAAAAQCEYGVKTVICARCNPKLEAVFKAKGDWCAEHSVPESQCVQCHPELAEKGVK